MTNWTKSLFLLFILLHSFQGLLRDQKQKDKINQLFYPKVILIPMKHVQVITEETEETLQIDVSEKKIIKKSNHSHLLSKNLQFNELVRELKNFYGLDPQLWYDRANQTFDDQSRPSSTTPMKEEELSNSQSEQTEFDFEDELQKTFLNQNKDSLSDVGKKIIIDSLSSENSESSDQKGKTDESTNSGSKSKIFKPDPKKSQSKPESNDHVCVPNAESLSRKEYLKAFARSKCSPILISVGIFGTKLIIEIDCKRLKEKNPEIFRICGWTSCENTLFDVTPKKEYVMWIPDFLDELNLLTYNQEKNICWISLFKIPMNAEAVKNKQMDKIFEDTWEQGWRISIFGDSEGSRKNRRCGTSAIEYLLPYDVPISRMRGAKGILDNLRSMGYRDGLTLQAFPYDFRLASNLNHGYHRSFKQSLQRLKRLTGKKSIVYSHSYGSVNSYSTMIRMSEFEKKDLIDFWIMIASPLMGDAKLLVKMITGENPTNFINKHIGTTKQQAQIGFLSNTFFYELLPINFWKFAKEKWFIDFVIPRILSENLDELDSVSRPSFFPNPKSQCYKKLQNSQVNCTYIKQLHPDNKLVTLKDKSYSIFQIPEILEDFEKSFNFEHNVTLMDMYKLSESPFLDYPNPGVPIIGVFFNIKPTLAGIKLNDSEFVFDKDQSVKKQIYRSGDGTVETYSALLPLLKWAHEYSNEEKGTQYPVKFIDLCSQINQKTNPFDSKKYEDIFQVNSYMGKCIQNNLQ